MSTAPSPDGRRLRAATRGSQLARAQTALVGDLLGDAAEVEPVVVETLGDRRTDTEIWSLGGQGVFVKEVQAAVLDGQADIAVHSAKDLPSTPAEGLVIAAVPERADARDALVGTAFDRLPVGGRVATGSVRRRSQLAWLRPDLTFAGLRGNLDTRLGKARDHDAIVVAAAALERLGRLAEIAQVLDVSLMVPQVGQGALAVECRADDEDTRRLLSAIDDAPSHAAVNAERAFLRRVNGGCDLPVGAYAVAHPSGNIHIDAVIATSDGRIVLRHRDEGVDPEELGQRVADQLLDTAAGRQVLWELEVTVPTRWSLEVGRR